MLWCVERTLRLLHFLSAPFSAFFPVTSPALNLSFVAKFYYFREIIFFLKDF
jgi:hypothetical protein